MNRLPTGLSFVGEVFPTGVGMNRSTIVWMLGTEARVPHGRGDEPVPTRGEIVEDVFPTGVGMNRLRE